MTASDTDTTLIKIGGTRKLPRPGDVFCMLLSDRRYLFGRVIIAEAYGPMPKANLVYIYGARADSPDPPLGALTRDALLIPPIWTNRLGWTKGYWKTIAHHPLRRWDRLEKHCFSSVLRHAYVDESGERTERSEPCGIWGLASYRSIEDDLCKALGLPLAPVDEQGR